MLQRSDVDPTWDEYKDFMDIMFHISTERKKFIFSLIAKRRPDNLADAREG